MIKKCGVKGDGEKWTCRETHVTAHPAVFNLAPDVYGLLLTIGLGV